MFKIKHALILITILILLSIIFNACGRKDSLYSNLKPLIRITSYEGVEETAQIDSTSPVSFRQRIYWEASDEDGVVEGYAFRITDLSGNHIQTYGYEVLDEDGWIYHYQEGADESIPLETTDAKTIWSNQVYADINFPANANGDSAEVSCIFEVKCIDDRDEECDNIARKYFHVNSERPLCTVTSTQGEIDGKTIGVGVVLSFNIIDKDPFVGSVPNYFKFELYKRDLDGDTLSVEEGGYPDTLLTTEFEEDVNEFLITWDSHDNTRPYLRTNNIINGIAQDSTFITAWAIDIAGIVSDPVTVTFLVKEGFYPKTLVYSGETQQGSPTVNDIYILGANHFAYQNETDEVIPNVTTADGVHFSTPFWIDKNLCFTTLHSNDLKIYMKWGYNGEYESNDPDGTKKLIVKDELTGSPYSSEIKYFDLRLDGEPYYYAPLPAEQYNYFDEETGKEWLRVPINHEISQETIFTYLQPGTHRFEVRAVDLQEVADESPAEFIFKVIEPLQAEEKEGIVIINDTPHHSSFSPKEIIDSLYSDIGFFSDYSGTLTILKRVDLFNNIDQHMPNLHFSKCYLSPTDLQQYKTVFFHTDQQPGVSNFAKEYDVLNLYLRGGGNLILSGGANLKVKVHTDCSNFGYPILENCFGIPMDEEDVMNIIEREGVTSIDPAFKNLAYFIKATGEGDLPDIDITLPSLMCGYVTMNSGLGPVCFFDEDLLSDETTVIYRFGCKPAGDDPIDPTQSEFDEYNGQPVALLKDYNGGKCYIFGFPLSFMEVDMVKTMLAQILEEIEQ